MKKICADGRRIMRGALATCVCALGFAVLPAQAQFASGGTGAYRDSIFWVNWGNIGEDVFAGRTITSGFNVGTPATAANRMDITCQLSNAAAPRGTAGIRVYPPGNYMGDGLDELYNIGGNQPGQGTNPNTLTVGLATYQASTVEFDLSCSATLGGTPFPLQGLVFADAEASGSAEFVAARLTSGGTVRIVDQISQCGEVGVVTVAGNEVRFSGPAAICGTQTNPLLRAGPALVGYIDGATSARIIATGGGVSAVAVGAVLELEYSESIPSSFGIATHILEPVWSGGVATTDVNYHNPANLATRGYGIRLGATILPDQNASGAIGGPDVDALPKTSGPAGAGYANVALPNGIPGSSYQIPGIACVGPAAVAGWIDFNGNAQFDPGERSATVNCPSGSGSVTLAWTLPTDYLPQPTSHLRLRMASSPANISNPDGVAADGEVEDYRLELPSALADLRIDKTSSEPEVESGGEVTYTIAVANDGPAPADGAVITDPQPVGLDCSTGTLICGSEAGGAACPASPTVAGLQGAGLIIPTFPAGGSLQLTLTCTVSASGNP